MSSYNLFEGQKRFLFKKDSIFGYFLSINEGRLPNFFISKSFCRIAIGFLTRGFAISWKRGVGFKFKTWYYYPRWISFIAKDVSDIRRENDRLRFLVESLKLQIEEAHSV